MKWGAEGVFDVCVLCFCNAGSVNEMKKPEAIQHEEWLGLKGVRASQRILVFPKGQHVDLDM